MEMKVYDMQASRKTSYFFGNHPYFPPIVFGRGRMRPILFFTTAQDTVLESGKHTPQPWSLETQIPGIWKHWPQFWSLGSARHTVLESGNTGRSPGVWKYMPEYQSLGTHATVLQSGKTKARLFFAVQILTENTVHPQDDFGASVTLNVN